VLDSRGNYLLHGGERTLIAEDVAAAQEFELRVDIQIPGAILPAAQALEVGLLYEGKAWFETLNPRHSATVRLC
jgi:hypothetical protein